MSRNIDIEWNFDKDLRTIVADRIKVKQIALNLFSDALKLTRDGGSMHVEARFVGQDYAASQDEKGRSQGMPVQGSLAISVAGGGSRFTASIPVRKGV
jgi:signal transduction histidine kinase